MGSFLFRRLNLLYELSVNTNKSYKIEPLWSKTKYGQFCQFCRFLVLNWLRILLSFPFDGCLTTTPWLKHDSIFHRKMTMLYKEQSLLWLTAFIGFSAGPQYLVRCIKQNKRKKKLFSKMRFGIILTGLVSSAMGIWEFQNHPELASETRLFPGTIDTKKVLIPDKSCACCVNFYFTYL